MSKEKRSKRTIRQKISIDGTQVPKDSQQKQSIIKTYLHKFLKIKQVPETAQQSIPYITMYRDGICRVLENHYTKTLRYTDINYQLARNEDKSLIFDNYCKFLNYFDSSISVQLSFINKYGNKKDFERSIEIPHQDDEFNSVRREYSDMLKSQLAKGNNGLIKQRYITFGVDASSLKVAKQRLGRIEIDVINNFKVMNVRSFALDGRERLKILHGQYHPFGESKLHFDWKDIGASGVSTKDSIAPTSFDFSNKRHFRLGQAYGATSFVQIIAPEISDELLKDLLNIENAITVNLHIKSINQAEALKMIKRKITDIDAMKITEQKKAVRAGYDMDVIPTDIETYGGDARETLRDLQNNNERMFQVTMVIANTAITKQSLENQILATSGEIQKYNCELKRLEFQQEQGLNSSLVLGNNQLEITRGLTTAAVAIFVPFTTQELYGEGVTMYYGLNALSSNLIMADRRMLKNSNGLILGTPGSGKSFAAKREATNVFFVTTDHMIFIDPEGEYTPLINRINGQVVKLSPSSPNHINPMDITLDYSDGVDPLSLKADFILSLCELIIGTKDGLNPVEKSIIDRCVRLVYRPYIENPLPENMPMLEDLHNMIIAQDDPEAKYLSTALEIYVSGSLSVFNNRTNVDLNNRVVSYDIKGLGKNLKKIAMLVLQEQLWSKVTANRAAGITTWIYVDEFHLLLKEQQTAQYAVEMWKLLRKRAGVPTGITQNVKDFLLSPEIENILENSDFMLMLNQGAGDRRILANYLDISPEQLSHVTQSGEGEGLIFYDDTIIPFVDKFPKDTELYGIMTTKPRERI